MPLPDRAANVLATLLAEPGLREGQISFVTHSFGGLIFEQLLRLAVDRSSTDEPAATFANRVGGALRSAAFMIRPSWPEPGLLLEHPNRRP